jgi:hypothetical protein
MGIFISDSNELRDQWAHCYAICYEGNCLVAGGSRVRVVRGHRFYHASLITVFLSAYLHSSSMQMKYLQLMNLAK